MKRRYVWQTRLIAAAGVLLVAPALAAEGVLTGTVIDTATKRPAEDVVVTATSPALQLEQTVVTDGAGRFRIPHLPPGVYTLRLEKEAYRPLSRTGIELRIDTTLRVDSELLPEAIQSEEIVVVAGAPAVDIGSSATGAHVNSDFVSRLPVNPTSGKGALTRSFESLAEAAPGVQADQFGASISGTSSPENQYAIDGLSVNSPALGILGTPLALDFVKEVHVITGGYMPEYGRAIGGYLDVATKTGSNELHGSFFFSTTPGILAGSPAPVKHEGNTISTATTLSSIQSYGAEIGGPFIRDKLWFYAGVVTSFARYRLERNLNILREQDGAPVIEDGFTQTDVIPGTQQIYYATQRSISYIGKLTYLVNQDNTITLSFFGAPTTSGGDGTFGLRARDGMVELNTPQSNGLINGSFSALARRYVASPTDVALKWSSAFNNKTLLLDTTLGWHHEESAVRAADGTRLASGEGLSSTSTVLWRRTAPGPYSITDFEASDATQACVAGGVAGSTRCPVSVYYSGGPGVLDEASLDRYQGKSVLTSFFPALGQHLVKAGIDIEVMRYAHSRGISGVVRYAEIGNGSTVTDLRYGFLSGPDDAVSLPSLDTTSKSITIGGFAQDSWSILDRVTLNVGLRYDAQLLYRHGGDLAMSLPSQWSPRLGVIYDPTQAGRAKLFANFARFYQSVPLNMVDRRIPGEQQIRSYYPRATCELEDLSPEEACAPGGRRGTAGPTPPFEPNRRWTRVVGESTPLDPDIEPQSADEIVVGGEYEILPRLVVGAQYTKRYQNYVIEDMSRDEGGQYFIGNPGYGVAKDIPKAVRDYDAGTFYVQKSFADTWLAQASYTISYLRGNWVGLFRPETGQLEPNVSTDFDMVSLLPNLQGPLPGDRTHQIKLFGAKDILFENGVILNLGASYRARSGKPTSYYGAHPLYGLDTVYVLPRGSGERLPWVHDIDAHIGVGVRLARESTLLVSVDSFNLFNFQGVTATDERYTRDTVLPISGGTPKDLGKLRNADGAPFDPSHKNPNFGNPVAHQPPRTFRLNAKVTF
ncbi:TonB-dependent receptor [Sorangium cellulosum]|uniref:TonB-dependent receptor n=1 Tax=Sorangium cellulosum TaxID=56 RepID=A0A2L0EWC3_SORCE|nr:TonB-dependent receptor [Sorangium cellulosum]AUX43559.1 TonB-dependent receptor [Sorangium cellulosum]